MIIVQPEPIHPTQLLEQFTSSVSQAGAIVSFTGSVRSKSKDAEVSALQLDSYPGFTEKVISAIVQEARDRFSVLGLLVAHRHGLIGQAVPIVFVAAAALHRRAAFEAADYLMDQLKTRAPFWKKEIGPAGSHWIEPRAEDYRELDRWA